MRELKTIYVRDLARDTEWPAFSQAAASRGYQSILAPNRCSPEQAFAFLRDASNTCNFKVREVAKTVIASITGTSGARTHFDD